MLRASSTWFNLWPSVILKLPHAVDMPYEYAGSTVAWHGSVGEEAAGSSGMPFSFRDLPQGHLGVSFAKSETWEEN
jgi:hypothetical protein